MTKGKKPNTSLVGKAFHTLTSDGAIQWQGEILSDNCDSAGNTICVAQLYGWIAGCPTNQVAFTLGELAGVHANGQKIFTFYDNIKDANAHYYGLNRDSSVARIHLRLPNYPDYPDTTPEHLRLDGWWHDPSLAD